MAIQIKLKNSVVQDSTPSTSDLPAVGELALNANINSIGGFMRASDNSIVKIFGPGSVTTPTATTTVSGISELATNSETTTGTATNRVVTPAGLNAVTVAERTTSNTNYVAKAGSTMTGVLTMPNGSNSAPAINFGDSDSGIYAASGGNNVRITVGGSDAISASTGGGINFSLAAKALTSLTLGSQSATDKPLFFADANSVESSSLLLDNSSNEFRVRNNRFSGKIVFAPSQNIEKARIDNAGRFLVGQSASVNVGSTTAGFLQIASSTGTINSSFAAYGNNSSPCMIAIGRSRSGTVGTAGTALQDDDVIGLIRFAGDDGTDLQSQAASIAVEVDGTPGANDMPGRLVFGTTADGAASPTERLRIDSSGNVGIGTTSPVGRLHVHNAGTGAGDHAYAFFTTGDTGATASDGLTIGVNAAANAVVHYREAGNLTFGTSDTERMRIDSSGDVGIGTSSPSTKLVVSNGGAEGLEVNPLLGTVELSAYNRNTTARSPLDIVGKHFKVLTGNPSLSTGLYQDSDGNVGIGTTSPDTLLDISSSDDAVVRIQSEGSDATDDARLEIKTTNGTFTIQNDRSLGTSGALTFAGNTSDNLVIDHDTGNVGIGTSSTSMNGNGLKIYHTNTPSLQLQNNATGTGATAGAEIILTSAGVLDINQRSGEATIFKTANTERMRIDSSGRMLIGTSASLGVFGLAAQLQIAGDTAGESSLALRRFGNSAQGAFLTFSKSRNGADGNRTIVQNGDELGRIAFCADDGTDLVHAGAEIAAFVDGTPGSNDIPGRLSFYTTPDGSATLSERMRIDFSGNLLHGVTSSEDTTGNSGTKLITAGDLQIDGDQKALVFRSTSTTAQKQSGIQWWNETGAGVQCAIFGIRETTTLAKGALAFYTSDSVDTASNNGEGNITERMRIDSSGRVMIGVSSTTHASTNADDLCVGNNDSSSQHGITIGSNVAGSIRWADSASGGAGIIDYSHSDDRMQFYTAGILAAEFRSNQRVGLPGVYSSAGSSMRDVQIESDGTLCGLTSITAAKTNIADLTDVSWLYNLKPKTFNFRKKTVHEVTGVNTYLDEAEDEKAHGFLAEDVETINKDFCFYNKDSEGNDVLAGVYYKTMVVPLVKAVQDLKAENTALAIRVAALEAA